MVDDFEKKTIEEYSIKEGKKGQPAYYFPRKALITIEDGKFHNCKYWGVETIFTLEDWVFLHKVAKKIMKLAGIEDEK